MCFALTSKTITDAPQHFHQELQGKQWAFLFSFGGSMGPWLMACPAPMAKEIHQAVLAARVIIPHRNNPSNKQNQEIAEVQQLLKHINPCS